MQKLSVALMQNCAENWRICAETRQIDSKATFIQARHRIALQT